MARSFFSHKLDKEERLALGTHIYRHINDDFLASFYHGIVYEVPPGSDGNVFNQNTLIFTVTKEKGLCLLTMKEFKDNHSIRQAYYDASKSEMLMHRNGTCYKQSSLPWSKISENIETLMSRFKNVESKHFEKLFKIHQSIIVYCMSKQESDDMKAILSFLSKKEGTSSIRSEADNDVSTPICIPKMNNQNDSESVAGMKSIECIGKDFEIVIALKPGDHVSRKLGSTKGIIGYHHGIVIKTPQMECQMNSDSDWNKCDNYDNYNNMMDNSLIIEMTRSQGIRQVTLRQFSMECKYKVKIVEYGVSMAKQVANCLVPGLFHTHKKSSVETILHRAKSLYDQCKNNKKLYDAMQNNCEQMALWCMTGIISKAELGDQMAALGFVGAVMIKVGGDAMKKGLQLAIEAISKSASKATGLATNVADDLAVVASNAADDIINVSTKAASAAKISAAIGAGVAVAVETGLQVYRHHKYLTTFEYTKYDYIMDTVEGWSSMLLTTGTGVGLTFAFAAASISAWWVLLPTAATMGGCYLFWRWYRNRHGKTEKEKWYYEYKIDWKCLENLKDSKMELEKMIEKEQLNPDMFDDLILNDKEKQENIKKYLKLNQIIQDIEIDMAYFEYNNEKYKMEHNEAFIDYKQLIVFAQLGNSVLRKQIKKEKLHPDLFGRLEITEQEKQRRQAKMETFLEYVENMAKEIKLLQKEGNDAIGKKSKKNKISWKSIRKMFQRKEKVVLKAIEYN